MKTVPILRKSQLLSKRMDITIHVTSVGGCERQVYHKLHERDEQLPSHFTAVRGTMAHTLIERCIKGNDIKASLDKPFEDITYPKLLGGRGDNSKITERIYNKALPFVDTYMKNFETWISNTDIDLSDMLSEQKHELNYRGIKLSGTMDLHDDNMIIDFKTGKKTSNKEHIQQLGGYVWMLKELDIANIETVKMVYLGKEDSQMKDIEVDLTGKLPEGKGMFIGNLHKTIETYRKAYDLTDKYELPCKFGFMCGLCGWRHRCSGI